MAETSLSLLDRLRSNSDEQAWLRLVTIYTPLIRAWLRRHSAADQDVEDVVQEVLSVLFRKLPAFERADHPGAFRGWLKAITVNCLRDFWRRKRFRPLITGDDDFQQTLAQLEDPASELSRKWDDEHDRQVTQQLLELIEPDFTPKTWRAFRRVALEGVSADNVAAELDMSVGAVYIAKSRVLSRLREEGRGLIEANDD